MKTVSSQMKSIYCILIAVIVFVSCNDEDTIPSLEIPEEYTSSSFDMNVTAEAAVLNELSALTDALNQAEADAQSSTVSEITYPSTLSSVTLPAYKAKIDGWLSELVKAANSTDAFQNPGADEPADGQEGGLLGGRLLDENGLELEQMIEKGSYGAACYNHALTVINGNLDAAAIDKLIKIFGTDVSFSPADAKAAAKYAKRRSYNETQEGLFYDIKNNLITAKAAIEAGSEYNDIRDEALAEFKLNWEKSNFATVINYCYGTKVGLQNAAANADALGSAMHAYAEGVGFTHGFLGISDKKITDQQIESILELLLAPAGETPESYKFLNDASLLGNFDQIIDQIQTIYGFTNEEVAAFYVNDPT